MNQYDVAGLLQTYAERVTHANNDSQLKRQIKNLKELLDLRTIRLEVNTND